MIYTNADMLTRRGLLESGRPLHYYMEYLYHTVSCIRQLSIDTLKVVNVVKLKVNSYNAVDLPDDFVDDVGVSVSTSALYKMIPKRDSINDIISHSSITGQFEPNPSSADLTVDDAFFGYNTGWLWFWNMNDFGEPTGRFFGANAGDSLGYKVIKERRQIQFDNYCGSEVILLYISDGQSADSASQVDSLAWDAIRAYQNWKASPNADVEQSPEGMTWINQRRILRARLNDLTTVDIINIFRSHYKATIKN